MQLFNLKFKLSWLQNDLFLPCLLIIIYIIFLVIIKGTIPTGKELVDQFGDLYRNYGYIIIFFSAFLEALILVNVITPGSIGMAMGAVFARTGQVDLGIVIVVAFFGSLAGYILDYLLGYCGFSDVVKKMGYGNFVTIAKSNLKRLGTKGLVLGFINPTIGSYLSFVAGTTGYDFKLFLLVAVISSFIWLTLWAVFFYMIGKTFIDIITNYSFLIILLGISIFIFTKIWKKGQSNVRS